MPIKVAHITPSFGCGGLERVIANLLSVENDNQEPIEHTIISLSSTIDFKYALPKNVKVLTLNKQEGLDLKTHITFIKLIRKLNIDVIHTYNFATLEYHFSSLFTPVKRRVHADHGLGGDDPNGANLKHNIFRKIISFLIHDYVVVSNDLKNWLSKSVKIPKEKINFIFNGVPVHKLDNFKPRNKNSPFRFVIVGRLAKVKNHLRLMEGLVKLKKISPNLKFHCDFVGDGPELKSIKDNIDKLNLSEHITLHGHQEDVTPFIKASDALVLSSDYEAMPMTALEAMSLGVLVVCPKVGGVEDFLSKKEAILVNGHSSDAIASGLYIVTRLNDVDINELRSRAHRLIEEKYSVEIMAREYEKIYTS